MPYTPLTPQQFEAAQKAGFSFDQIVSMEEKRKQEQSVAQKPKEDPLKKVGNFLGSIFGGNKIGEALGQYAAKFSPEARELERADPVLAKRALGVTTKPKEIIGDVAQAGLTLGTLGGGGLAGTFGKQILKSGVLGAGFGVSEGLKRDEDLSGIGKRAGFGAVVGGALPIAGKALGAIGRAITIGTPKHLANYALRVPLKQAPKEMSEAFLQRGLGGKSLDKIHALTQAEANQVDQKIHGILSKSKAQFKTDEIFNGIVANAKESGMMLSLNELKARVAKLIPSHANLLLKKVLTAEQANSLRIAIDNNLRAETAFGPFARSLSNEQKLVKAFDTILRNMIKKRTGTEALFKQQSEAIGLAKLAEQAAAKFETQGRPGLLDLMGAGIGGAIGGLPGAAVGVLGERALRDPRVLGGAAQTLRFGSKLAPVSKIAPAVRFGAIRGITSFGKKRE